MVLWDFDGTLAERPGLWSQALIDVLDGDQPGHGFVRDDVRAALRDGFPWHRADEPHPHLNDPEAWWAQVGRLLAAAYRSVGYDDNNATRLAGLVRERFLDPERWRVFDDATPALRGLAAEGWSHVIVSNHVPELAGLVEALDLADYFDHVVTSAGVGFDKPHPAIFEHALELAGRPRRAWMIGDSPTADIAGADAVGIPAILVRREADVSLRAQDLIAAADMIMSSS